MRWSRNLQADRHHRTPNAEQQREPGQIGAQR